MLHADWTITARLAVLRLAQMKYQYFWPRKLKQNPIFSGTSHQNRSYLSNILTNRQWTVGWQHRHCSSLVTEEVIKITLHKQKALTPIFQNSNFSTLWQGWLQCIASAMQRLPTLQNHLCQVGNAIISELKLDHVKSTHIKHQPQFYAHWVILVPNLEILFRS